MLSIVPFKYIFLSFCAELQCLVSKNNEYSAACFLFLWLLESSGVIAGDFLNLFFFWHENLLHLRPSYYLDLLVFQIIFCFICDIATSNPFWKQCVLNWLICNSFPYNSFPGGSDGKSTCLQCERPRFSPWVRKISWRKKWQPTPVLLPGKFHGRNIYAHIYVHIYKYITIVISSSWMIPWS